MKQYRIRPGHSFRLEDGSVAGPGDVIDLAEDVAAQNPGAVELVVQTPAQPPAQGDDHLPEPA